MCLLQKSYRFGDHSGIGSLARAVNASARAEVKATLRQPFDDISRFIPSSTTEKSTKPYSAQLSRGYGSATCSCCAASGAEPQAMLAAFSEFQLLCALREGTVWRERRRPVSGWSSASAASGRSPCRATFSLVAAADRS